MRSYTKGRGLYIIEMERRVVNTKEIKGNAM
jgi:hypothetical protein